MQTDFASMWLLLKLTQITIAHSTTSKYHNADMLHGLQMTMEVKSGLRFEIKITYVAMVTLFLNASVR